MKFARTVFLIAGIYGLIVLVPLYFLEERTGRDLPPPITHPEYYYGFIGLAVVWQILFLVLSSNPRRYRPMMIAAILEKLSFVIPVTTLILMARVPLRIAIPAIPDLVLGVLFVIAYLKTAEPESKLP